MSLPEGFDPTIPPLLKKYGEKFCFLRLAEEGDGAAFAACLYEGVEDTYPHPQGRFGATADSVDLYLNDGPAALIQRKGPEHWERVIATTPRDGSLRAVARADNNEAIAFCWLNHDEEEHLSEVDAVYGRREWRRVRGYHAGSLLVQSALLWTQDHGSTLHAATTAWNEGPLYGFYEGYCGGIIVQRDTILPKAAPLEAANIDLRQSGLVLFNREELRDTEKARRHRMDTIERLRKKIYLPRQDKVDAEELIGHQLVRS